MSENEYRNLKKTNKLMIPVILMMGFVPLLVHMYSYNSNLSQFDWFPANSDTQTDFFFAWKMIAIVIIGVVMAAILLYRHYVKKETLQFENSFYFLMVYGLFVLMSALFSKYKHWVSGGTYELFESVWVVFAYMLLCYYVYNFVNEEKHVEFILKISGIGMAIVTVIGVFQYFGLDFFQSNFGKHLITNPGWWKNLKELTFNFAPKTSYTTLYNPNFLSFYFGMLIVLAVCLFIASKKIWHRIVLAVAVVCCAICLKGSGSASGWMALALAAVVLILVLLSRKKKLFVVGAVVVVIGIIAAIVLGNTTSAGENIKNTIVGTYRMSDRWALNGVETNTDDVVLDIHGNKLSVSYTVGEDGTTQISCKDSDGNELSQTIVDADNQVTTMDDSRFSGVQLQPVSFGDSLPGICATIDGVQWNFINTDENGYEYLNPAGKLVKFENPKVSKVFLDDAMSNRGHIWNKTIPLLGRHAFMGSGANTYMFEVPQNDYISQNYVYGANSYDVKAHSWYLQQWVETGLLGTLALLVFLFWYLVQSIRIYRRVNLHESISWVGFGLFAAVLVYMFAGIVNDSNVCTAPVFWGMLGLGLAVNRMLVKKENLFAKEPVSEKNDVVVEQNDLKTEKAVTTETSAKKQSGKKQSRKQRKSNKS